MVPLVFFKFYGSHRVMCWNLKMGCGACGMIRLKVIKVFSHETDSITDYRDKSFNILTDWIPFSFSSCIFKLFLLILLIVLIRP
jgi:hypothetical protein